eukprot:8751311-Pyramimonas_sp.AAC.1
MICTARATFLSAIGAVSVRASGDVSWCRCASVGPPTRPPSIAARSCADADTLITRSPPWERRAAHSYC